MVKISLVIHHIPFVLPGKKKWSQHTLAHGKIKLFGSYPPFYCGSHGRFCEKLQNRLFLVHASGAH